MAENKSFPLKLGHRRAYHSPVHMQLLSQLTLPGNPVANAVKPSANSLAYNVNGCLRLPESMWRRRRVIIRGSCHYKALLLPQLFYAAKY
jgi:hypothetical protein